MSTNPREREPLLDDNGDTNLANRNTENGRTTAQSAQDEIEGVRLYLSLIFPLIGLFFVALDVTMVSTVSATIASEFSSLAVVSWLGSAYLVAVAAVQPISGKLTDRVGRRTGFFGACFFFGTGNLLCGLAPNEAALIAGRVLAGTGGGAISSIGTFVISDLLPLRKRAMWQASGNIFWAMGMGIGGVFGGLINDLIGWRWTFIIMVPCTLVVAVCVYFTLIRGLPRVNEADKGKPTKDIDILGSVLLSGALICFVLGLNLQEKGKNKLLSLILLIVAAVLLICFIIAEVWFVPDPVIPVHLFANRSVTGACLSGFFISIAMYSLLFYVPVLIQVRGYNTKQVGLQLLGNPLGTAIGPFSTGVAIRVIGGYGVVKPIVFAVFLGGAVGWFFSTLGTPVWATVIFMALQGAGFGSILTFVLTGLLANIDDKYQATGTGMQYAFRQTGASAGLAIAGIIFRAKVESGLAHEISQASGSSVDLASSSGISQQCSRSRYVGGQPPRECEVYFDALHAVFLFVLVSSVAGSVCGMMVKNKPLDRKDGKVPDDDESERADG